MNQLQTIQDLVKSFRNYSGSNFVSWKEEGETKTLPYLRAFELINAYSRGFLEIGLNPKDRVAIFSSNVPMWSVLTLAINNACLIDVPRGQDSDAEEINYILEHSKAKVAIVENEIILQKLLKHKHKDLELVLSMDKIESVKHIVQLEQIGSKSKKELPKASREFTASIIYTSGSTGIPKGVELTHYNFISNAVAALKRIEIVREDKFISILPAWHVFERVVKYAAMIGGAETFYTTQKTLLEDVASENPSVMASVPRIWERVYNGVMKKVKEQSGIKRSIFNLMLKTSIDAQKETNPVHPVKLFGEFTTKMLDSMVFAELRAKLGKKFRLGVSGGSKLPDYIDDFFNVAKIELIEGYGLTETSPVIAVREIGSKALYTVGPIIEGVSVRIIDSETGKEKPAGEDGIIYVKGPNVMKGYYRNFEETRKILDHDGWLDTGDIGHFDNKLNLVISGREKDIVVLSNGENVNPVPLETVLSRSDYIASVMVTGHDWKSLGALIVPNMDALKQYCEKTGINWQEKNIQSVLAHTGVQELYRKEILRFINRRVGFKDYELIREFRFLSEPFEVGRELTATLKLKRKIVVELYGKHLESMK
ncbi:MAG: long-chain fatty acid--CoA ligase, partial [Candidatus Firestonebacteria bacterium]